MPDSWSEAVSEAVGLCNGRLKGSLSELSSFNLPPSKLESRDAWLIRAAKSMLDSSNNSRDTALAFLFVGAQLSLSFLPLKQRAQYPCRINSNLEQYLVNHFCPRIYQYLSLHIQDGNFFPDLDGNMFLVFLNCAVGPREYTLEELLGPTLAYNLESLWTSNNLSIPDLRTLFCGYSYEPTPSKSSSKLSSELKLLPFSHAMFNQHLPLIAIAENNAPEPKHQTLTRVAKLCDAPVGPERHWHNANLILPKYLGGQSNLTTTTAKQKNLKAQRWERQFMMNRTLGVRCQEAGC